MAIIIEAYEDWGPAVAGPTAGTTKGTNRTKITNANLKTISDPAQNYYLNDVPRPIDDLLNINGICSFTRWISFKISGSYTHFKNLKITIPAGFAADNWRVNYALRSTYSAPTGVTNEFNKTSGAFDGTLTSITSEIVLYPNLSKVGPEDANSFVDLATVSEFWTQYLVLQFVGHPSTYDDADNFGTESITVTVEELEGYLPGVPLPPVIQSESWAGLQQHPSANYLICEGDACGSIPSSVSPVFTLLPATITPITYTWEIGTALGGGAYGAPWTQVTAPRVLSATSDSISIDNAGYAQGAQGYRITAQNSLGTITSSTFTVYKQISNSGGGDGGGGDI